MRVCVYVCVCVFVCFESKNKRNTYYYTRTCRFLS